MKQVLQPTAEMARINVTPIIDVALVLVIILLITAPILAVTDREIELPSAVTQSVPEKDRIHVTLGHLGDLGIEDRVVTRDEFVPALRDRLADVGEDKALVVVRADKSASHGAVKQLLDDARSAGARRLAFAVRPGGGAS
jgi:biopolymer transport protein TolR